MWKGLGRGHENQLMVLLSWLRAMCVLGHGGGPGRLCVCVCTLCCEHLRALVAMHSGLAFLSLHCFTYKMGTVAFAVGPGGCSEAWAAVLPPTQMALVSRCLPLTVCV